jgi:hypothetical protein
VDGTGSGSCPVAGFGISGVETRVLPATAALMECRQEIGHCRVIATPASCWGSPGFEIRPGYWLS